VLVITTNFFENFGGVVGDAIFHKTQLN